MERRCFRSWEQRSLSFSSKGIALGSFPEATRAPETIINLALFFDDCPSTQTIASTVVPILLEYDRLSGVPVPESSTLRPSNFIYQPEDLVRHFVVHGDDEKALYDIIFEHLHDPLTQNRNDLPWWEFLVIENKDWSGRSACVFRIHHCLADGMSVVHLFEQILTDKDGSPVQSLTSSHMDDRKKKRKTHRGNPVSLCLSFLSAVSEAVTMPLRPHDDVVFFNQKQPRVHSGRRKYLLFPTIPLSFVKELKNAAGVTVNDVLMTATSQAIHDYCVQHKCPTLFETTGICSCATNNGENHEHCGGDEKRTPKKLQFRAMLPVALPRKYGDEHSQALRNHWCFVSADLALGYDNPIDRLHHIHDKMRAMKETPKAYAQHLVQNKIGPMVPLSIWRNTVQDVFCRHSLIFSDVPGPVDPCWFSGESIQSVQTFCSSLMPQIQLLSYAGQIYGNMVFDPASMPNDIDLAMGKLFGRALLHLAKIFHVEAPYKFVEYCMFDN